MDMSNTDDKVTAKNLVIDIASRETKILPSSIIEKDHILRHLSLCLILAHAWDRAQQKNLGQDKMEAALSFFQEILEEELGDAAKDSLQPLANVVCRALEQENQVGAFVALLSDRNMSKAARKVELDKQKLLEAELKARVMQEQWPDREEIAAARFDTRLKVLQGS